jgi:hypothetical protein
MYGERPQQEPIKDNRVALLEQEIRSHQQRQDALSARIPPMGDQSGQVRLAIYGLDRPGVGASVEDLLWYCTSLMGRIPASSKEESWQRHRTFIDLTARASGSVNDSILRKNIMNFIFRLESMVSTADPQATQGLTGIQAITTSTRYERSDQNIRNVNLPNSPGLFDGIMKKITGGR